jgi:hypothetical protein
MIGRNAAIRYGRFSLRVSDFSAWVEESHLTRNERRQQFESAHRHSLDCKIREKTKPPMFLSEALSAVCQERGLAVAGRGVYEVDLAAGGVPEVLEHPEADRLLGGAATAPATLA